jgi:hypothetical protein
MTSAPDMTASIAPRSDQLNAEDLLTGPRTVTITDVTRGTTEQPVNIVTAEFGPGRPYKPSKTMRRVIVAAWGTNTATYIGRRLTIYRDPDITFGRDRVGGIRISHLSNINKRLEIALTVTRGRRATFAVDPLPDQPQKIAEEPQDDDAGGDAPITKPQLQKLSILRQNEGYADNDEGRADWFAFVESIIGRTIGTNKALTKAEASVLIDVLENAQDETR